MHIYIFNCVIIKIDNFIFSIKKNFEVLVKISNIVRYRVYFELDFSQIFKDKILKNKYLTDIGVLNKKNQK